MEEEADGSGIFVLVNGRLLLTFALLVCLASCGNSSDLVSTSGQTPSHLLKGTWSGQFPPSEGDEGVEIHFQPDFAFFVREGQRVARQRLVVEQNGAQVHLTLTSETDPQNQAVFRGNFANSGTIVGRYTNGFLVEDFDLTLVERPQPVSSPDKPKNP